MFKKLLKFIIIRTEKYFKNLIIQRCKTRQLPLVQTAKCSSVQSLGVGLVLSSSFSSCLSLSTLWLSRLFKPIPLKCTLNFTSSPSPPNLSRCFPPLLSATPQHSIFVKTTTLACVFIFPRLTFFHFLFNQEPLKSPPWLLIPTSLIAPSPMESVNLTSISWLMSAIKSPMRLEKLFANIFEVNLKFLIKRT